MRFLTCFNPDCAEKADNKIYFSKIYKKTKKTVCYKLYHTENSKNRVQTVYHIFSAIRQGFPSLE